MIQKWSDYRIPAGSSWLFIDYRTTIYNFGAHIISPMNGMKLSTEWLILKIRLRHWSFQNLLLLFLNIF